MQKTIHKNRKKKKQGQILLDNVEFYEKKKNTTRESVKEKTANILWSCSHNTQVRLRYEDCFITFFPSKHNFSII